MSNKDHKSTGIEYTYFTMHTLLGMAIFFFWSSLTNLFANFGLDLFYELFITMFFSGILARSGSYLLLWYFTRKAKGMVPSFYKLTFLFSGLCFLRSAAKDLLGLLTILI